MLWLLEWQEDPEPLQGWELWQEDSWLWQDLLAPISSERQQSCLEEEMVLVRGDLAALLIHPHSLPSLSSILLFIPPLNPFFPRLPKPSQIPPQLCLSLWAFFVHSSMSRPPGRHKKPLQPLPKPVSHPSPCCSIWSSRQQCTHPQPPHSCCPVPTSRTPAPLCMLLPSGQEHEEKWPYLCNNKRSGWKGQ